jgi:uncharacterized protein (TIGR02757 family)
MVVEAFPFESITDLKSYLDEKVLQYNNQSFIDSDPVQIPHLYDLKEDIEISAFLSATISWGNRKAIVNNAMKMMELMGNSPYDFVMSHNENDLIKLENFVHRTFNGLDFITFIKCLQNIYLNHEGLEAVFYKNIENKSLQNSIVHFKKIFFEIEHSSRTEKHVSDPSRGSAAKRINMFLRWMCRKDKYGVDLGIWKTISPSLLSCPLDIHSGNVARKLQLISRKQNDSEALFELDTNLRLLDKNDPVKYDFALFGIGVYEFL